MQTNSYHVKKVGLLISGILASSTLKETAQKLGVYRGGVSAGAAGAFAPPVLRKLFTWNQEYGGFTLVDVQFTRSLHPRSENPNSAPGYKGWNCDVNLTSNAVYGDPCLSEGGENVQHQQLLQRLCYCGAATASWDY